MARAMMSMLVLMLMLVATTVVKGAEDGNDMGKCLLECSEKVVMCAAKCSVSGGKTTCFEDCGNVDVKCVNTCIANKDLPA